MCSDMIALCMQFSVTALADLQCSKIMFFANRVLASPTRHFPPEASVAVVTKPSRTCLLLKLETVLL